MTSRVFVTGGAGFVGGATIRRLRGRGDDVVAVVRDPDRAGALRELGVVLVRGDLSDATAIEASMAGCDAALHLAGSYRVGIAASERPAMHEANVGTTERVLDAAVAAGIRRAVYVSTVGIFGNTHGRVVDETYRRDLGDGFVSYYDESKYAAHVAAEARISAGAPIVIVQPSQVYGPGDRTALGEQLRLAHAGRLRFVGLGGIGLGWVHVDDLADGIVAALDRGTIGLSYVLSGPTTRVRDALQVAAEVGGHRLPRLTIPDAVLRFGAALAPNGGARFDLPPNLREIVSASIGVTYWASSARAVAELGFAPRDLAAGLRATFGGPP